jgi:hypothetical protein
MYPPFDRLPSTGSGRQSSPNSGLRTPDLPAISSEQPVETPPAWRPPLHRRGFNCPLPTTDSRLLTARPPPFDELRAPALSQLRSPDSRTSRPSTSSLRQAPFDRLPSTSSGRQPSPDSGLRTPDFPAISPEQHWENPTGLAATPPQEGSACGCRLRTTVSGLSDFPPFDKLRAPALSRLRSTDS